MKFATAWIDGQAHVVVVNAAGNRVWKVGDLAPGLPAAAAGDMVAFVTAWPQLGGFPPPESGGHAIGVEARLLAPFPRPTRDIICVGKNYRAHAVEFASSGFDSSASSADDAVPQVPIIFGKSSGSVIGPDEAILMHPGIDTQMDYEVELAVVIGKPGRGIRRDDALEHVFGYTIVNDVTARDLQGRHKQWYLGKSLDGSCPMGPWIVTRDDLDLAASQVICRVNGEVRQQAATIDMIFDVPALIETISAGRTLEPGDIIATGTPAGVALSFDPPRYLRAGDVVEVEVDAIGKLSNPVRGLIEAEGRKSARAGGAPA